MTTRNRQCLPEPTGMCRCIIPDGSAPDDGPDDGRFVPPGIWLRGGTAPRRTPVGALFLDRDGVVVEEVGYLHDPQRVRLMPGLIELLQAARESGLAVAVATNQSGIARGYFGWHDYWAVETEIARRLADAGAWIDGLAACPFHPEHMACWTEEHDRWRKPGPGMIQALAQKLGIDPSRSWMVGDTLSDIAAARAAGLAGAVHVLTGHGPTFRDRALRLADDAFPVLAADDLFEAAAVLEAAGFLDSGISSRPAVMIAAAEDEK